MGKDHLSRASIAKTLTSSFKFEVAQALIKASAASAVPMRK